MQHICFTKLFFQIFILNKYSIDKVDTNKLLFSEMLFMSHIYNCRVRNSLYFCTFYI